jgi:helicase required for RNAi-mediated heterochromatin assembly 1
VTFKGLQISRTGVAVQVEFSHERAGKQIRWEQSKRLLQGTLVALSPSSDMFRTKCKVAIVASRSLKLLSQNPPAVQLKWGDSDEAVIDPVERE